MPELRDGSELQLPGQTSRPCSTVRIARSCEQQCCRLMVAVCSMLLLLSMSVFSCVKFYHVEIRVLPPCAAEHVCGGSGVCGAESRAGHGGAGDLSCIQGLRQGAIPISAPLFAFLRLFQVCKRYFTRDSSARMRRIPQVSLLHADPHSPWKLHIVNEMVDYLNTDSLRTRSTLSEHCRPSHRHNSHEVLRRILLGMLCRPARSCAPSTAPWSRASCTRMGPGMRGTGRAILPPAVQLRRTATRRRGPRAARRAALAAWRPPPAVQPPLASSELQLALAVVPRLTCLLLCPADSVIAESGVATRSLLIELQPGGRVLT